MKFVIYVINRLITSRYLNLLRLCINWIELPSIEVIIFETNPETRSTYSLMESLNLITTAAIPIGISHNDLGAFDISAIC